MANLQNARFISEILGKFALDLLESHRKNVHIPTPPPSQNPTLALPVLIDIASSQDFERLAVLAGTGHSVAMTLSFRSKEPASPTIDPLRDGRTDNPVFITIAEGRLTLDDALHNLAFKPVMKTL